MFGQRFREIGMDAVANDAPPPAEVYAAAVRDGRVWVAELDGSVVGYVWAIQVGGRPHLEQISVRPEAGGRGVGQALVAAVLTWAEAGGATSITLSTFTEVAWNGPWYTRQGFEALADDQLDDALRALRAHEAEFGLDVTARAVMRARLPR